MALRVLLVTEPSTGGVAKAVLDLAFALHEIGTHVTVVHSGRRADETSMERFKELEGHGIEVIRCDMHRGVRPFADAKVIMVLRRLIRNGRFDVVHAHSSKAGLIARLAAFNNGLQRSVVYTPHALATNISRAFWIAEWFLGKLTDRVIAVSDSEAESIVASGVVPRAKVAVVYNGIAPAVNAEPPPKGKQVLTIGRLSPQKDPDLFLEIARRVAHLDPDTVFSWVGDGDQVESLRNEVRRLGLSDRIEFHGRAPAILPHLARCTMVLSTSRYEGFPYALLEAMAAGRPVVATNVTGNRDAVVSGVTGYLFPRDEPEIAARLIVELGRDRDRLIAMGAAAGERAREFTTERMAQRTLRVYESAAAAERLLSPPPQP